MSDFKPMEAADAIAQMAEVAGGCRRALTAQGFTPDQASTIVVAMYQQMAAEEMTRTLGLSSEED